MRLIQADPLETAPPVQGCRITSFRVLGLDALTMKERSGMPYDVVAYEADDLAMQLSESEEGLFHRMLRRAWMNGSIPSDLKDLTNICRTNYNRMKKAWIRVSPLWIPHPSLPGRLINSKQESERDYREQIRSLNRLAGVESAKVQKTKRLYSTGVEVALNSRSTSLPSPSLPDPVCIHSSNTEQSPTSVHASRNTPRALARGEKSREEKSTLYDSDFENFWAAYPKKIAKGEAWESWKKARRPPTERLLQVVELAKQTSDWKKNNGQFIPKPATWLNQKRWDDEYKTRPTNGKVMPDKPEYFG